MRKVVTTGITALGIASAAFALTVLNPFSASAQELLHHRSDTDGADHADHPGYAAPATPGRGPCSGCPNMGGDSGTQTRAPSTPSSASPRRVPRACREY